MSSVSIAHAEQRVLDLYEAKGRSRKTLTQIRQVVRELRAVGVTRTNHINEKGIGDWLRAWPARTPVTCRSHLRCLSAICTRWAKWHYIAIDPFEVDSPASWVRADSRPAPARKRWAKPAPQVRAMLELASKEDDGSWDAGRRRAYVWTLFLTGGRDGEIRRLRLVDFDPRARTITIVAHWVTGRGGRRVWWAPKTVGSAGVLPIGDRLVAILSDWSRRVRCDTRRGRLRVSDCEFLFPGKLGFGPWMGGARGETALDQIRALGERAGISGLTAKAARKGLGTYNIGLSPSGRRKYFRHSDDAIGDLYDECHVEERRGDAILIEQFFTGT